MEEDSWSVERRSAIFSELKRYCLRLLELHQNPSNSTGISLLLQFLRNSSPDALHPFLDSFSFTLLPLLLLFDMAVDCRSRKKMNCEEKAALLNAPAVPPKLSDSVAEGVDLCLEELLKKCRYSLLQSADEPEDIALHFFHVSSVLHQVIVDAIGIFSLCLRKDFASSGLSMPVSISIHVFRQPLASGKFNKIPAPECREE
ncbi:hypothetical protein RJ641_034875 [Dillenia turbinata]|uniref:Uncharacterized protein n=1 Tax=Dillenia turbinata TaxID=194707 RepID=A0AAN8VI87_9MAGN